MPGLDNDNHVLESLVAWLQSEISEDRLNEALEVGVVQQIRQSARVHYGKVLDKIQELRGIF